MELKYATPIGIYFRDKGAELADGYSDQTASLEISGIGKIVYSWWSGFEQIEVTPQGTPFESFTISVPTGSSVSELRRELNVQSVKLFKTLEEKVKNTKIAVSKTSGLLCD